MKEEKQTDSVQTAGGLNEWQTMDFIWFQELDWPHWLQTEHEIMDISHFFFCSVVWSFNVRKSDDAAVSKAAFF